MWRDSESDQDFLNFTELADQIATLIHNPAMLPISIGVFGTWGTGKSMVLRLVESRLPIDLQESKDARQNQLSAFSLVRGGSHSITPPTLLS